jgi:hypothetical protein
MPCRRGPLLIGISSALAVHRCLQRSEYPSLSRITCFWKSRTGRYQRRANRHFRAQFWQVSGTALEGSKPLAVATIVRASQPSQKPTQLLAFRRPLRRATWLSETRYAGSNEPSDRAAPVPGKIAFPGFRIRILSEPPDRSLETLALASLASSSATRWERPQVRDKRVQ